MASISDLGQEIIGFELQADVDDLFMRMREATEDYGWRKVAGKAAAKHAHEKYTWKRVVESMVLDGRFASVH